jgi:hypothetical protein
LSAGAEVIGEDDGVDVLLLMLLPGVRALPCFEDESGLIAGANFAQFLEQLLRLVACADDGQLLLGKRPAKSWKRLRQT